MFFKQRTRGLRVLHYEAAYYSTSFIMFHTHMFTVLPAKNYIHIRLHIVYGNKMTYLRIYLFGVASALPQYTSALHRHCIFHRADYTAGVGTVTNKHCLGCSVSSVICISLETSSSIAVYVQTR